MRRALPAICLTLLLSPGCGDTKKKAAPTPPSQTDATASAAKPATSNPAPPKPRARPKPDPSGDRLMVRSAKVMGTRVTISIWGDDEARAARASEAVFAEFRRIDKLMTSWGTDSDVAKLNASAGKTAVVVDPEVLAVIQLAQQVSAKTGGAFDITVGAFRGLWKFDQDIDGTIPPPALVKQRLARVGHQRVSVDAKTRTVKLGAGQRITLGGIAKGYAVDRAVEILHKLGHLDFILQAGGDLYTSGKRGARKWRVGIRDPRGPRDNPFALAEIKDHTFSTSGDYERGLIKNGVRYHHILDPKTGFPVKVSRSVTVMAKKAIVADAWSTALFVLGVQKGMPLVESLPELEAVFVDDKNQVHVSSGLKGKLWIMHKPTDGI